MATHERDHRLLGWAVRWGNVVKEFHPAHLGAAVEWQTAKAAELLAAAGGEQPQRVYLEAILAWELPVVGKSERLGFQRRSGGRT